MRRTSAGMLMGLALVTGLSTVLPTPSATAGAPSVAQAVAPQTSHLGDAVPDPVADKQRALRQRAVAAVLKGEATPERIGNSTVVKIGEAPRTGTGTSARSQAAAGKVDQYVQLSREDTDQLFVLVVEFGDRRHPDYPDRDTDPDTPGPAVFDGPRFNQIPRPDRSVDNATDWNRRYGKAYYRDLYFGNGAITGRQSMRQYYERQSSGRYSVAGMVTDVVRVPYNEARYGRSNGFPCDDIVCSNTWELVRDGMAAWVAQQRAAGQTGAQIRATLKRYDVWDRYDADGDGNFDERDGYIDHLQIVHAGGDQADGDPQQGEDAIWSHRWRAFQRPDASAPIPALGGTAVGRTGIWASDYTIQPENGGLSVVAHEFGHDLGLPDLYDRFAPPGKDNPVNWWSLMAQSRVSAAGDLALGSRAADLGPWEKLQLGWLDYEVAVPGQRRSLVLGPHEYNSAKPQALAVVLPDKPVTTELGDPAAGTRQWWSGSDDDLESSMSRRVALPTGPARLTFQARWNIEDCGADPCDYAFVEVDSGSGWTAIPGSITKAGEGHAIDGLQEDWVRASFDLSAFAGRTVGLRIRYVTDGAVQGQDPDQPGGIFVDDIVLTAGGRVLLEDGAEPGDDGWTLDGFSAVAGSVQTEYDNFYLASNREYVAFDRYLRTGPYNFGFPDRPNLAEHFPYQDGVLVWYWDTSVPDNDTTLHPGEGLVLPVDAHPVVHYNLEGRAWRGRIQMYDATFGLQKADSFTLHVDGKASYLRGRAAAPTFDDSDPGRYAKPAMPYNGVRVAGTGTRLTVLQELGTSVRVRVRVGTRTPQQGLSGTP